MADTDLESTLPAAVRALLDATNAGDLDGFLGAFTTSGVVDDWGREFRGEDIRRWSDAEVLGKNVTLEVTAVHRDGDVTIVLATVGGDGFNGPSTFGFAVEEGRISSMTIRA